jgi:hypothetical protein
MNHRSAGTSETTETLTTTARCWDPRADSTPTADRGAGLEWAQSLRIFISDSNIVRSLLQAQISSGSVFQAKALFGQSFRPRYRPRSFFRPKISPEYILQAKVSDPDIVPDPFSDPKCRLGPCFRPNCRLGPCFRIKFRLNPWLDQCFTPKYRLGPCFSSTYRPPQSFFQTQTPALRTRNRITVSWPQLLQFIWILGNEKRATDCRRGAMQTSIPLSVTIICSAGPQPPSKYNIPISFHSFSPFF